MARDWPQVELADVAAELTVGHVGPMVTEYRDRGVPFIRSTDIKPFRIDRSELKFINPEFHAKLKKSALRPGDVVVVRTGKPGTAALIPNELPDANCSDVVIVRAGPKLDARYLVYFINSTGQAHVNSHSGGAVQQHFNVGAARKMRINLPPLDEQREVASILGALDDKIELNRRMNATLEAMAQAVFKEWFVAGAKEEWEKVAVNELANVIYGAPFASKLFNTDGEGAGLIRIRELSTHEPATFTTEQHVKGTMVHPGDIIVGMDGEFRVHHWRGVPALLNQRVCMFKPKEQYLRAFLALSLIAPMEFYERSTVGTTVIHLGKSDIDEIRLLKPPDDLLKQFGQLVEPMLEKRLANAAESRTLAALRDTLLPKLMRGEVRVKNMEKA
ncbi:MAG: restriction endonuclease subunit S [Flavobacteriales bacterium]